MGSWFCDAGRTGGSWHGLPERVGLVDRQTARQGGADPAIAGIYSYRDACGAVLYEMVRKRPKAFACRRPDGHGRWIWNLR
jgi:hypothetical protein